MKKIAKPVEYKFECDYCDTAMELYDKDRMENHESLHRQYELLQEGDTVTYQETMRDGIRNEEWSVERTGTVVQINVTKLQVLVETEKQERKWVKVYKVKERAK